MHEFVRSLFLFSMSCRGSFLFGKKKAIDIEPIYNYISEYELDKGFHQ